MFTGEMYIMLTEDDQYGTENRTKIVEVRELEDIEDQLLTLL